MPAVFLVALSFCLPAVPVVPYPGPVVAGFVAPACTRCAGHRGITMAVRAGAAVASLTDGTVLFDGTVARRRFIVLGTPAGDRVTYGDLTGPAHAVGLSVGRGATLGESTGRVYVGVRRRGVPVDPRFVIGSPGPRLVAPAGLACPVGAP